MCHRLARLWLCTSRLAQMKKVTVAVGRHGYREKHRNISIKRHYRLMIEQYPGQSVFQTLCSIACVLSCNAGTSVDSNQGLLRNHLLFLGLG